MVERRVIALILNTEGLRDDYQGVLRRGVEQACVENDVNLWVLSLRADQRPREFDIDRFFDVLGPDRVSGVVIATGCIESWASGSRAIDCLRSRGLSTICSVGQVCSDVPAILIDNRGGATALVDHLVQAHARRQFAYLGGPKGHDEAEQRLSAFLDALARHGIGVDPSGIFRGDWSVGAGSEAIQQFLAQEIPFDAVVAANDDMAFGALAVLRAIGFRCPDDVSVVGFDNVAAARFCQPPLTTASQPLVRLGTQAVKRIVESWSGKLQAEPLVLNTELVLRESCGCHPTHVVRNEANGPRRVHNRRALRDDLRLFLSPIFDAEEQRDRFAVELADAVTVELSGKIGALKRVVDCMAQRPLHSYVPLYELQRVVSCLRDFALSQGMTPELEESFHAARVLISSHAYRREGEMRTQNEYLLELLRVCGEHLAKCLDTTDLRQTLATQLPHLGIQNAYVALLDASDSTRLVPLVSVLDGVEHPVAMDPYPASRLLPSDVLITPRRQTLTVLPLACDAEYLGVAVIELPQQLETYSLLREQIGNAIRAVALHQEVLVRERSYAQVQEEMRATTEKLRSLGLVASGVAHDLTHAMRPLAALPDAIERDLARAFGADIPHKVVEDLALIRAAGQNATLTIRDMLALGKPYGASPNAVDLNRALEQERPTLAALCDHDPSIAVDVELSGESLVVPIDRAQLLSAITNLIVNAAEAIEGSGTIRVRARYELVEHRMDGIEAVEPGAYAVIDVIDSGHGTAKQRLPRILEPSYSDKKRSGVRPTELGLTIVHRIVREVGGYLHVLTRVGQGTTFSLYFPLQSG